MTRKLKTLAAGLTALALTITLVPAQAVKVVYPDVDSGAWYYTAVGFCQQHGLMEGEGGFDPEAPLTRAALTEALYRLEGSPVPEAGQEGEQETALFSDVLADHPNQNAIRWAAAQGVVTGYPDGTFQPQGSITREEIAVLLWRCRGQQPPAPSAEYSDRGSISDWALAAVEWARGTGIMSGTPDNCFLPRNNATRAEGATLVMNYAKAYYGLEYGYPLPEPGELAPNPYNSEAYILEESGLLRYEESGAFCCRGLDVSAHQEEIDWTRVAAAGMDFAMIRAGYRGYTQGAINKDAYFDANMQGALSNGMEVGVYFFSQAITPAEAEEEAYILLDWIRDYSVTYPVVFDWEEQDRDTSRTQGTDGNTVTACALAFCKIIEEAGYIPMTYGSPRKIYSGGLQLEYMQNYPFWLAHYTKDTAPTSFLYNYHMWQYSSTGAVDGIEGNVDLNICLTDWSAWNKKEEPLPWWAGPI